MNNESKLKQYLKKLGRDQKIDSNLKWFYFLLLSYIMGVFGGAIGSVLGTEIGAGIGKVNKAFLCCRSLGGLAGKKGKRLGSKLGGAVRKVGGGIAGATLIPFKTGGKVNAPKNKPVLSILHGHWQEFVLPVGIKPTKAQVKAVAMLKRDAKK